MPTQLAKDEFQTLVLQAGSVDMTNLNTRDSPTEYLEYYKQEVVISAKNCFQVAVNALSNTPNLEKVILMKQVPRYDPADVDPLSLKPALSQLYNNTLTAEWMDSQYKDKIMIGNHNIECSGAIKEARYRETKSGRFDGIHLFGASGRKTFTLSVLNIFRSCKFTSSEHDYHQSCEQYKYQDAQRRNRQQQAGRGAKYRNNQNQKPEFSLHIQNRFESFSEQNQGNY